MSLAEPPIQSVALFEAALSEIGRPDRDLARRLALLVEIVFSWSRRMNLTGHQDREGIARGLVLDALGLASLLPACSSVVDLGSGAGFPGLAIALARTDLRLTLVESREKRHHFQRAAIRELSIQNVEARLGRAEVLEPAPHRAGVARAVGPFQDVVSWMLPWLEPEGLLLLPIRSGIRPLPPRGATELGIRSYRAPLGGSERRVWVGIKNATD